MLYIDAYYFAFCSTGWLFIQRLLHLINFHVYHRMLCLEGVLVYVIPFARFYSRSLRSLRLSPFMQIFFSFEQHLLLI